MASDRDEMVRKVRLNAVKALATQVGATRPSMFVRTPLGKVRYIREQATLEGQAQYGATEMAQVEKIFCDKQNILHVRYSIQEYRYGRPITAKAQRTLSAAAFAERFGVDDESDDLDVGSDGTTPPQE